MAKKQKKKGNKEKGSVPAKKDRGDILKALSAKNALETKTIAGMTRREFSNRLPDIYRRFKESFAEELSDIPEAFFPDHIMSAREASELDCVNLMDRSTGSNAEGFKRACEQSIKEATDGLPLDLEACRPFIKEGILKHYPLPYNPDIGQICYLHFLVLDDGIESGTFRVRLCEYHKGAKNEDIASWTLSWFAEVHAGGNEYGFDMLMAQDHIYKLALQAGFLTSQEKALAEEIYGDYDPTAPEETEPVRTVATRALNALLSAFRYMNTLLAERDVVKEEGIKDDISHLESEKIVVERRSKKNKKKRIIFLGGPVLELTKNSPIKTRNGQIVRHTLCWGVRGHIRRYKNGRTIYIKPYEKGPERGNMKPEGKEYRAAE